MVCRNCSAKCPPQAPPSSPSIGHAGCSGNWASLTAPWNVTGYCCCPGNVHPPITTWFWRCCCSGGGSKPAVPSVEKLEKLRNNFKEKEKKKYLGYSSAYMAAVRRKWWAELIGLPVSGPMFSPFRHSWRISCLAVDSAGKKYWEKWFRIPCYKLITWWIYTLKYNIQARR